MRVITGRYRRRRLRTPTGLGTRPILDRVKVAIFDWLGAQLAQPGSLPPIDVLDLFCGGGGLGIEALSRGAASCVFVEADKRAFRCLVENLDELEVGPAATALNGPVEAVRMLPAARSAFGLIFIDPPYPLSRDVRPGSVMARVMARLGTDYPVESGALALWRHDAACEIPDGLPGGWRSSEKRTWGTMTVTLLERTPGAPA